MKNQSDSLQEFHHSKGTTFKRQLQRVYEAFYCSGRTMKEVDSITGIMRESICRYCAVLRKQGRLFVIGKRKCMITGFPKVTEYTSNPDLVPTSPQINLFGDE